LALFTPFTGGKRVLFPIPSIKQDDILYLRDMAVQGSFAALIDRKYPLEQIRNAHRYVDTGQKIGNVLVIVCDA
jgi:NADPH:quinone reductase-like Zn-dependent oxidoreductase